MRAALAREESYRVDREITKRRERERERAEKCGNSDSGASVFHKGPRVHSLNGPPRAHCAHCRGSCLAHKHASRPESADE